MKKILFVVLALAAVVLSACGGGNANAVATLAPVPAEYASAVNPGADAAAGAEVFATNCESCHGPQGHGDGPAGAALDPQPKNLAELQLQASDAYLYWRINAGKEGTSMVAWKGVLTDEQIWQVIAFIRTLK
ncbi:MAG: hypothetical protein Fur002_01870 [Anaerolineales bacterium]